MREGVSKGHSGSSNKSLSSLLAREVSKGTYRETGTLTSPSSSMKPTHSSVNGYWKGRPGLLFTPGSDMVYSPFSAGVIAVEAKTEVSVISRIS